MLITLVCEDVGRCVNKLNEIAIGETAPIEYIIASVLLLQISENAKVQTVFRICCLKYGSIISIIYFDSRKSINTYKRENIQMNIAIITGASAGLGKVFFEKATERYQELDEIWIIARREDRLKELAAKYPDRNIRVLPLDLSLPQSFEMLDNVLSEQKPNIKVLINNAGFDRPGLFRNMKYKDIYSLINVNVMGMTMISRCCHPYMSNGSYEIIVGSVGAFVPLPWRAVYGATKTYGRFLARAIRQEEKKNGINVMFMAPGAMDTEMFHENMLESTAQHTKYLDLDKATVRAMKKAEKGAGAYSPTFGNKVIRAAGKIIPSAIIARFSSVEKVVPKE